MDWEVRLRQQYAIVVRPEWLEQVMAQLRAAHPDLSTWHEDRVLDKIFTAFLFCDLNQAGSAALPANTKDMHKEVLVGKFVLQLDEVVNMAAAARERYSEQSGGRCLKLALTDGCQQVVAVEHAHLPVLTWDCPAGSKVLIHNVPIRRGLLLLGPDNTALLGGQVERLEAARQRAVAAWIKPIVGRPAGSAPRDIFAEARRAAWAPGVPADAQPRAGPGGAAAGTGLPGAPAGVQPQGGLGQQQPPAGSAFGAAGPPPGMEAAGLPAQQRHPAPPQQAQHQQPPAPAVQQQQQPQAVISGIRGQALAAGGGAGAAAPAPASGPPWQHPLGSSQIHQQHQHPQQHQQQQGWHQQQPQAVTQARAPTPPTQSAAPTGAPVAPPWLGRSANPSLGGAGSTGNPASMGNTDAAAPPRRPGMAPSNGVSGSGVAGTATDGGRANGGGPNGGAGGGGFRGAFPVVDLATSSDSAGSGDSQSRSSNDQPSQRQPSHPQLATRQPPQQVLPPTHHPIPHPHEQEPPLRRRLPPSMSGGASLLGGSAAAPPPASAAPGLGLSTSSSGLLPPRPTTAAAAFRASPSGLLPPAMPPPVAVTSAAGALAAGTAGGLRKLALPLARSSPGPSGSLGSIGRVGAAAAPSPTSSTAALNGPLPSSAQRPLFRGHAAGAGAGPRSGRDAGLAVDVEMVDLAALDDDDEGGKAGGSGGGALPGEIAGPRRDAWLQEQRAQGCKSKLQPPLNPAGRTEKRPRLSPEQPGGGASSCSFGSGGSGGGAGRSLGLELRAGQDGAGSGFRADTVRGGVRAMQMDMDSGAAVAPEGLANGHAAGAPWDLAHQHGSVAGPVAATHHPVDSMAVEVDSDMAGEGHWGSPGGWPDPGPDAGPPPPLPVATAAASAAGEEGYAHGFVAEGHELKHDVANHAGVVLLCQVPDLLQPGSGAADAAVVFPMTVDVYGLFHVLDGDTALIEDGTAMVEAQLTDSALAPFLADAEPPAGFAAGAPIGLAEIQLMADSPDPAVQAYGQELAVRIMDFIRDFSGLIRLEYREPLQAQPLIIQLTNDVESGPGDGQREPDSTAGGAATGSNQGSGMGCRVYERYLHDLGALRLDAGEVAKTRDWHGE